jgi:CheY-like chemotaxis protein
LKFGDPTGCVCVYLNVDKNLTRLSFSDTGKGVAPDFIRHVILDPFSQEDPQNEGTGLGLANVKHAVAQLGGRMAIDSDESWGSTFTVTFPSEQIAVHPPHKTADLETVEPQPAVLELPQLEMSLFMPRRWEAEDHERGRQCVQLALDSLMRGVSRWFQTKSTIWRPPSPLPRLLFILLEDLHRAIHICGDEVHHINIVVLCPDVEKIPNLQKIPLQNATIIVGPVTTSSLEDALTRLFPGIVLLSKTHSSFDQVVETLEDGRKWTTVGDTTTLSTRIQGDHLLPAMLSDLKLGWEDPDDISSGPAQQSISPKPTLLQSPHDVLSEVPKAPQTDSRISSSQAQPTASNLEKYSESNATRLKEPKLLLVDDNSINLKVLVMFARKCSTIPSKSAGGGQEAIDAFNEALMTSESDELQKKYDLVFLDLSMPEISGFDVARKIRELEAASCLEPIPPRTYICALTGLVSPSDRKKAFDAGVDEYISKPAKLEDIKAVISNWRNTLASQQQYG